MDADIRKLELKRSQSIEPTSTPDIEELRGIVTQLRETSTQHALSLQHTVERLDHRVEFIERKLADTYATPNGHQLEVQQIGTQR